MAISVKDTAIDCLSVSGTVSVRRDIFGYIWGSPMNRTLSVKKHLKLIRGTAINLCIFLVAHEPDFSGEFTIDDVRRVQEAVDRMRELYAQVELGVRKLYWRYIPTDEANGYSVVDGAEATRLTEDFSGPNDGLDVFIVTTITDAGGWSTSPGSCDKDRWFERTGSIVELKNEELETKSIRRLGLTMAHEVGHYLGLEHGDDITTIMGTDENHDGKGETDVDLSTRITADQADIMESHCSVKSPC